jgi:CheY-like chemotaxis protein
VRAATPALAAAEQVLDLVRQRAGAKGIDLRLITTSTLPATIETDANRLRQILINLVGNGIKFTDAGEVRLEVGLFRTDGRTRLSFAVVDTGVGMPPEVTSRLFETFSQADASMTRRFGGTGLGLAIAQRLATRLGGEITVESVLGEGSRFTLTIDPGPIDERTLRSCGATGSVATTDTGAASLALSGHVLLVEDNAVNQKLALAILARSGLEVDVVSNGSEAVEQALSAGSDGRPYDLIILDMQMPVMDGYTAARTLRGAGYTQPILALTAHAMADDRERCLACGCDDYATKPFDRAKLLSAVARNLNPAPRSLAL